MLSKSLSTSEKFAALNAEAGPLAEFCQALYPLLVAHTDDFGRQQGDPFTVKHVCFPCSPRSREEFAAGLEHLARVGLIDWYLVANKRYIQIEQFEEHQQGLHKRTRSMFPRVPGTPGNPPEVPGSGPGKYPEIPGQEKRIEEKRREVRTPQTPLKGGRALAADTSTRKHRLTRAELQHAKAVRARVYGRCPHESQCADYDACVEAIALARRERQVSA
jgi:hypothetical protein